MDQQASQQGLSAQPARGRSPSPNPGHQQPGIRNSHSPSPHPYQHQPLDPSTIGLGLGIEASTSPGSDPLLATTAAAAAPAATASDFSDASAFLNTSSPQPQSYTPHGIPDVAPFDPSNTDLSQSFTSQGQVAGFDENSLIAPEFNDGDFSLFPPVSNSGDSFDNNAPLFGELSPTNNSGLDPAAFSTMTSPQTHHSPTPPHLLKLDPGAPQQPPTFNQNPFGTSPGHHSRNTSLGPESALLPNQVDWNQAQFQTHRRSPSEYSDVSSAAPSPNLAGSDSFDPQDSSHSPLQQSQDGLYQDVMGLGNFTLSDTRMAQPGRSPSHSPAMSPRLHPTQQMPDSMLLNTGYPMPPPPSIQFPVEQFPSFPPEGSYIQDASYSQDGLMNPSMAPPSINIDYAPTARQGGYEPPKGAIDQASLTPPDRGRIRSRPRAVTDPYNSGGGSLPRSTTPGGLSPHMGANAGRSRAGSESSAPRSVSPASLGPDSRSGSQSAASRRRQSMNEVPNNVIALRLADPEYQAAQDSGNTKRVQKHPATFQCTLCPKRFTRAYNLRSHLRTHTDERPFVCTVCGKAFARQHDRKRHEGLHSGEKKFVCKGDLKAGGQWGCGRRFARADALGRHFRSEAGRICIKPLLDEEMLERQRQWEEQRMQSMQNMGPGTVMDPGMYPPPMEPNNTFLPAALLAQYPALAQMNWAQNDMGNVDEEVSGRSSFDNSDYDDEGGYVSGPGTGFGDGGLQQGFGEVGYSSDYGSR